MRVVIDLIAAHFDVIRLCFQSLLGGLLIIAGFGLLAFGSLML